MNKSSKTIKSFFVGFTAISFIVGGFLFTNNAYAGANVLGNWHINPGDNLHPFSSELPIGSSVEFTVVPHNFTSPTYSVIDTFSGQSSISNNINSSGVFFWAPVAGDIGSHSLLITVSGDGSVSGAMTVSITVKYDQTITFTNPGNKVYSESPFTLSATTTSSLPITFSVVSGPATWNGTSLTLTSTGLVTVKASQAGNDSYFAAPDIEQTFTVISSAKAITSFNFTTPAATGVFNETAHTIAVTVPYGTVVAALVPTITISTGASVNPISGIAQDFTDPVTYTVTAADASTQAYTVIVAVTATTVSGNITEDTTWTLANSPYIVVDTLQVFNGVTLTIEGGVEVKTTKDKIIKVAGTLIVEGSYRDPVLFTSFGIDKWGGIEFIDSNNSQIEYSIIENAGRAVDLKGISVVPMVGNIFKNNTWVITDTNGYQRMYFVNNTVYDNLDVFYGIRTAGNDNVFRDNTFRNNSSVFHHGYYSGITTIDNNNFINNAFVIKAPEEGYGYGTVDISNNWWNSTETSIIDTLIIDKYDDVALQLLSYVPIKTSEILNIGSETTDPNPDKAIIAFGFSIPVATGVINEIDHTIAVTVPFGTNVTALVPTIVITGASVSPASGAAQDFTATSTYTVTAADFSTQSYIVVVSSGGGGGGGGGSVVPATPATPTTTTATASFTQSISLKSGWNVISTPRVVNSHTFSAAEISSNFDIFVLDASSVSGWSTMEGSGQTEFTPLYSYFINNKTGADQSLSLTYKTGLPPNNRLFQRTFTTTGWYSIGTANPTYVKAQCDGTNDINNVGNILDSLTGNYSTVIDFTDGNFSTNPSSVALSDIWKAVVPSDINSLRDMRELKGYAIFITKENALFNGFQNDNPISDCQGVFMAQKNSSMSSGDLALGQTSLQRFHSPVLK
jgi:hypothetical protein